MEPALIRAFTACMFPEPTAIIKGEVLSVAEKVTKAIENGKNNAKLENEKELLKQKINDLEIQQLKKRISDLEEQLKNK